MTATETASVLQIRLSLWKEDSLPDGRPALLNTATPIEGVHILAHLATLVKENLLSARQKLDWQTGTSNYKIVGIRGGRAHQVDNRPGQTCRNVDGAEQVFSHSLLVMGTTPGQQAQKAEGLEATFCLRERGCRARLGWTQLDGLGTKEITNRVIVVRACGSGRLLMKLKANPLSEAKRLDARLN